MRKLLVICGPTATGKTTLAIHLAKRVDGELISADSKQVYQGLDIGTGKDLPKGAKLKGKGYYIIDGVRVWGYDLVNPKKTFSVANYVRMTSKILKDIWQRKKLPILVGGTGFYIKGVVDGIETVSIPPNIKLRKTLENKKKDELFEILAQLSPVKAASMNVSDRNNPRRLMRAIEIADANIRLKSGKKNNIAIDEILFVGLTAPVKIINNKIDKRIEARIKNGIEKEIRTLIDKGVSWQMQSTTSFGYRQFRDYFKGRAKKTEVIEKWKIEEKKYAKRQITWFKKDTRINWFNIDKANSVDNVEKFIDKWYKIRKKH